MSETLDGMQEADVNRVLPHAGLEVAQHMTPDKTPVQAMKDWADDTIESHDIDSLDHQEYPHLVLAIDGVIENVSERQDYFRHIFARVLDRNQSKKTEGVE